MEKEKAYSKFSKRAQEVAPQIEKLLNGLNFSEVESLMYEIKDEIMKKAIVTSSS